MLQCPICRGKGWILFSEPDTLHTAAIIHLSECNVCSGTGMVDESVLEAL